MGSLEGRAVAEAAGVEGDGSSGRLSCSGRLGMVCWRRGEVEMRCRGVRGGLNKRGDAVPRLPESGHDGGAFTSAGEVVGWPVRFGEDGGGPQLLPR